MRNQQLTQTANPLDDYQDLASFCEQLGISKRTAKRWQLTRTGPPQTRVGKKILYRKSAIAAWLKHREEVVIAAAR
jgi:hypothetical protein